MTKLEMVAAESQGNMTPPQETPIKRRVKPAVHKKIPRSSSGVSGGSDRVQRDGLTIKLFKQLSLGLSVVKEFKCWRVVKQVQEDDGKANGDDVDVETPSPTQLGVLDELASCR